MKDVFFGYYPPTEKEYDVLWKKGIIVLDTNVLLNLYRLPPTARDELMAVLAELKEQLWIPYQVGLEFQSRRLTVITAERKAAEGALESARSLVDKLKQKVEVLQLEKHGLGLDPSLLIADLEQANARLIEAITAVHKQQLEIAAADPIRDRLDQILSNKIGPGPATQEELDKLTEGAEQRYLDKIPPGYADSDKDKNPNFATFFHDRIRYQRKFGDLIMWRQLISYVKTNKIKSVLLVTAEQKEDWWWKEQGKIIGAQPELVREIYRDGGVNLFWIYSAVQFLKYAKSYVTTEVSDQAVAELQEISAERSIPATIGESLRSVLQEWTKLQQAIYEAVEEVHPGAGVDGNRDFISYLDLARLHALLHPDEESVVHELLILRNQAASSGSITLTDAMRYFDLAEALIDNVKERVEQVKSHASARRTNPRARGALLSGQGGMSWSQEISHEPQKEGG